MALKDANLIPFQIRQRQFLKEVFFEAFRKDACTTYCLE